MSSSDFAQWHQVIPPDDPTSTIGHHGGPVVKMEKFLRSSLTAG
jgi:hypothetical protein